MIKHKHNESLSLHPHMGTVFDSVLNTDFFKFYGIPCILCWMTHTSILSKKNCSQQNFDNAQHRHFQKRLQQQECKALPSSEQLVLSWACTLQCEPHRCCSYYLLCWVGLVVVSDLQLGSSFLQVKVTWESDKIIEITQVVTPLIPALGRVEGLHLCEFKTSPGLHSGA